MPVNPKIHQRQQAPWRKTTQPRRLESLRESVVGADGTVQVVRPRPEPVPGCEVADSNPPWVLVPPIQEPSSGGTCDPASEAVAVLHGIVVASADVIHIDVSASAFSGCEVPAADVTRLAADNEISLVRRESPSETGRMSCASSQADEHHARKQHDAQGHTYRSQRNRVQGHPSMDGDALPYSLLRELTKGEAT